MWINSEAIVFGSHPPYESNQMDDTSATDDAHRELSDAMTPSAVKEKFAAQGIIVSERTLREKARRIGACRIIGKTMFFMPSDIDLIIESAKSVPKVRPTSSSEGKPDPVAIPRAYDTEELIKRLTTAKTKTLRQKLRPAHGKNK